MNRLKTYSFLFIIGFALSLFSCTDKFDTDILTTYVGSGNINFGDTVYVQQKPIWGGFNKPEDLIVGKDQFIYVADTQNDRIVMFDLSGRKLGEIHVDKPVAIDQDNRKDLLVCGSLTGTNGDIYGAVFKIRLVEAAHQIGSAKIDTLLPKTSQDYLRPDRVYTGITSFNNNDFYVARRGPKNSNITFADNVILSFVITEQKTDSLVGRIPNIKPTATGIPSANGISSLTSLGNASRDIIVTLAGENSFKVQWLQFIQTRDISKYETKLDPFSSAMMEPNKFSQPEDAALDNAGNLFVADAGKDSIFVFNTFGDELHSFGGPELFDSPHAVAYFDRILYVLDTNNDRIIRFILSTELD